MFKGYLILQIVIWGAGLIIIGFLIAKRRKIMKKENFEDRDS